MHKTGLQPGSTKLLLAISGGVDSVVLAHLLKKGGYNFTMAHCNFSLRGAESNGDEDFCRKLADDLGVTLYVKRFDVPTYAKEKGISIQMAARDLRYSWFKELIAEHKIVFLLTAHHGTDVAETIILNLARGSSIKGMKGMNVCNGNLIRPLLGFTKQEILSYAQDKNILYRHDHSNDDSKYRRNFVRLKVMPLLAELNPNIAQTLMRNGRYFSAEASIVTDYLEERKKEISTKNASGEVRIHKQKLKNEKYPETLLHYILEEHGFNSSQEQNILENVTSDAQSGKFYESATHTLTVDREYIILQPVTTGTEAIIVSNLTDLGNIPDLKVERLNHFAVPKKNEIYIREEQLFFPVKLRPWKQGDKFQPFGMKGFKLVSDFFKDQKFNLFEKKECKLLENGNGDIMWIVGQRSDERYRINEREGNFIKISSVE